MAVVLGDAVTDETAQEEQTGEITLKVFTFSAEHDISENHRKDQKGN